jgi:hypothetical protein
LPPWDIDAYHVSLRFGEPEQAGLYLRRLFALAFQIKDGLIYLPGQYGDIPPPLAVRAESQTSVSAHITSRRQEKCRLGAPVSVQHGP